MIGDHLPLFISCLVFLGFAVLILAFRLFKIQKGKFSRIEDRRSAINQEKINLEKEIRFYEQRKSDLLRRSNQRNQLVTAARALGSCLDPVDVQTKLIETTKAMFPGREVEMTAGQSISQKPLLSAALLGVPIKTQGAIVGALRVGAGSGAPFSQDDLRMLDILGSLASLALENSSLFKQIQDSALRDNLTGLWTHKAFQEHLEAALLESSRYGQTLSLILLDVDHFKLVNDTHGHQAGDSILQGVSHVLTRHVRDVDVVARYGGEEFAILLLQTSIQEAHQTAEAIRVDLAAQRFAVGSKVLGITGSFGVATFPQDATSAQQLIRVVDERMYAAKKAGRNQVKSRAA